MPTSPNSPPRPDDRPSTKFLRLPAAMQITGLGRSTIYRLVADRRFPRPVRLGCRAVGWRQSDIESWGDERPVLEALRSEPQQ